MDTSRNTETQEAKMTGTCANEDHKIDLITEGWCQQCGEMSITEGIECMDCDTVHADDAPCSL